MAELLILDKDIPNSDIKPELVKMYFDDPVGFMAHVLKSGTYKICDLMLTPAAKDKYRNRPHEVGLYIYNKYSYFSLISCFSLSSILVLPFHSFFLKT
jgi:hypothetical protein